MLLVNYRKTKDLAASETPIPPLFSCFLLPRLFRTRGRSSTIGQSTGLTFPRSVGRAFQAKFLDIAGGIEIPIVACATLRTSPTTLAQFQSFIHIATFATGLRTWSESVRKPSGSTWKMRGSYATPHFPYPKQRI